MPGLHYGPGLQVGRRELAAPIASHTGGVLGTSKPPSRSLLEEPCEGSHFTAVETESPSQSCPKSHSQPVLELRCQPPRSPAAFPGSSERD